MKKYKILRFFTNLFSVFFLLEVFVSIALVGSQEADSEKNIFAILGTFCFVLFIVCIVVSKKLKKKIKQPMIEAQQLAKLEYQKELEERNALFKCSGSHVYGLPVAEDAQINCYWCRDRVLLETSGASFNLSLDKLTDVASKTDKEIQTATTKQAQYVSSAGRAVAGYMLLGPVGAAIGGRARKKQVSATTTISTPETHYMIFTYIDNEELKCIAVEVPYKDSAVPFVEAFKQIKPATTQSFNL